MKHNTKYTK